MEKLKRKEDQGVNRLKRKRAKKGGNKGHRKLWTNRKAGL